MLVLPSVMWAAKWGQTEAVQLLLGRPGINVKATDADGWTALIHATAIARTEVVQQLLNARDIDVNIATTGSGDFLTRDYDIGSTALMVAARNGHIDIVEHLLKAPGVDPSVRSRPGHTALSYASAKRHREIVDLLLAFTTASTSRIV
jgi:uncharacterized protein